MVDRFTTFIRENGLFTPGKKVLLAVSGGKDSMAMAELFRMSGFDFSIAHCNFQLRGKDSDLDEAFVWEYAEKWRIRFFVKRFPTEQYAREQKISIQMAARELRYAWFEETRKQEGFDLIATAHHLDDQVETFFINLLRGTGIAGLHGIPLEQGSVIRPMLFAYRNDIESFVKGEKIPFREDISNSSEKYVRNRIRHQLVPLLQELGPESTRMINETIARLQETEKLYRATIEAGRKTVERSKSGSLQYEISVLKTMEPVKTWFYELFGPFGFTESNIDSLIRSLDDAEGKTFLSATHRLLKDRGKIIILPRETKKIPSEKPESYMIGKRVSRIEAPIRLSFKKHKFNPAEKISGDPLKATLDLSRIQFPLQLRRWKAGDSFYPYGLNRKKKISDFLTDAKCTRIEKENTWVLCSGNKIIWVVGRRIDHRFRITAKTEQLLLVTFQL